MTKFEELEPQYMFEELNYKKYENHLKSEAEEPNVFVTQDAPYCEYTSIGEIGREEIRFDLYGKRVWTRAIRNDLGQIPCPINMKELIAIVRQCEEYGWIEVSDIKEVIEN